MTEKAIDLDDYEGPLLPELFTWGGTVDGARVDGWAKEDERKPKGKKSQTDPEPTRKCRVGANAGKPGVCPQGGAAGGAAATSGAQARKKQVRRGGDRPAGDKPASASRPAPQQTRRAVLGSLVRMGGGLAAGAKFAAGKLGQAAWDHLPGPAQKAAAVAFAGAKAVERKAMVGFHAVRGLVRETARQRGYSDKTADRVAKIVGAADVLTAWTVGPAAGYALGGAVGMKAVAWTPVFGLAFLAASTATNPLATWRAARALVRRKGRAGSNAGGGHHAAADYGILTARSAGDSAGDSAPRTRSGGRAALPPRALLEHLLARLSAPDGDGYEALLYAALDEMGGGLAEAMRLADEASGATPAGSATDGPTRKCMEGENAHMPGPCPTGQGEGGQASSLPASADEGAYRPGSGEGVLYQTKKGKGGQPDAAGKANAAANREANYRMVGKRIDGIPQEAEDLDPVMCEHVKVARDVVAAGVDGKSVDTTIEWSPEHQYLEVWTASTKPGGWCDGHVVTLGSDDKGSWIMGGGARKYIPSDAPYDEVAYLTHRMVGTKPPQALRDKYDAKYAKKKKAAGESEKGLAGGLTRRSRQAGDDAGTADRAAPRRGHSKPSDPKLGDDLARAEAMADVLGGLLGKRALLAFAGESPEDEPASGDVEGDAGANTARSFGLYWLTTKAWDPLSHPRGPGGRFVPKGSAAAVASAKVAIGQALRGAAGAKAPEHAQQLASHLSILTVKQLHDLKKEYGLKASGKLREQLVAKLLDRLPGAQKSMDRERKGAAKALGLEEDASLEEIVADVARRSGYPEHFLTRQELDEKLTELGVSAPVQRGEAMRHAFELLKNGLPEKRDAKAPEKPAGPPVAPAATTVPAAPPAESSPVSHAEPAGPTPGLEPEPAATAQPQAAQTAPKIPPANPSTGVDKPEGGSDNTPGGEKEKPKPTGGPKVATVPRKFLARGVQQQRDKLRMTTRTLPDGSLNPAHERQRQEVERLDAGLKEWDEFVSKARDAGFVENSHRTRTKDGHWLDEGDGFVRKEGGQWVGYTRQQVADHVAGVTSSEAPKTAVAPSEKLKSEYKQGEERPQPPEGYEWTPAVVERPGTDVRNYETVYRLSRTADKRKADQVAARDKRIAGEKRVSDFQASLGQPLPSRPKETYGQEFSPLPGAPEGAEIFTGRSRKAADAATVNGVYYVRYSDPRSNADATYWALSAEQYRDLQTSLSER